MNAGERVRKLAIFELICGILAAIICAIVFGRDHYGDLKFGVFLLIIAGGVAASWFSYIFLDAFSALVESNESICHTLQLLHTRFAHTETNSGLSSLCVRRSCISPHIQLQRIPFQNGRF